MGPPTHMSPLEESSLLDAEGKSLRPTVASLKDLKHPYCELPMGVAEEGPENGFWELGVAPG